MDHTRWRTTASIALGFVMTKAEALEAMTELYTVLITLFGLEEGNETSSNAFSLKHYTTNTHSLMSLRGKL